jgi:hypothetical protein
VPGKELIAGTGAAGPDRDPTGSPPLARSGILALALAGCLLSVGMHWAMVARIDSVTTDSLDRYLQSWQLAWIGHAAKEQPIRMVDSNTFWPLKSSLAFSDFPLGYAPAGLVGSGPKAAMIRYNLVFLFTYAMAFVGSALLAKELGLSWGASVVAGAAFAFAPWRLAHLNHLHVLSSGGIPLSLFLLLRGYRRAAPKMVFAGWAVATWQLSLGFTLGLQLAYLLAFLGALSIVLRIRRGVRPVLSRALVAATAAGVLLFAVVGIAQGLPLLEVTRDYPESRRPPEAAALFSPPPSGFLAAPGDSVFWAERTAAVRDRLRWPPEMALFPGFTLMLLVAAGLTLPVLSQRWRVGLGLGIVATAILCLGYSFAGGKFTYALLYDYAPGWQSSRTPGRLFTLTSLGLALAGAAGAEGIARWVDLKVPRKLFKGVTAGMVMLALLAAALLVDGKGRISLRELPVSPPAGAAIDDPQMHLPTDDANDPLHMFWSTDGFPRIFNGYAGFSPRAHQRIRDQMRSFPDSRTVELLSSAGFRSVVVHLDLVPGTPWEGVADRSIEGLGLEREAADGLIVYRLTGPG